MDQDQYEKKGYLNRAFQFFHLKDSDTGDIPFHYHDFDKIIVFLSGKVTYVVEGKSYLLEPQDILLVCQNDIHRPTISPGTLYERIVIYISPSFTSQYTSDTYDLADCFHFAKKLQEYVFRLQPSAKDRIFGLISELEHALSTPAYAKDLYTQTIFLEFMIHLNRAMLGHHFESSNSALYNKKIIQVVQYINEHLSEKLTVDALSARFYISRYHLMHKFKEETGYTLHNYIKSKRLLHARQMLKNDLPITQVCYDCGFQDYSTFSKGFKEMFHITPSQVRKEGREKENGMAHPG